MRLKPWINIQKHMQTTIRLYVRPGSSVVEIAGKAQLLLARVGGLRVTGNPHARSTTATTAKILDQGRRRGGYRNGRGFASPSVSNRSHRLVSRGYSGRRHTPRPAQSDDGLMLSDAVLAQARKELAELPALRGSRANGMPLSLVIAQQVVSEDERFAALKSRGVLDSDMDDTHASNRDQRLQSKSHAPSDYKPRKPRFSGRVFAERLRRQARRGKELILLGLAAAESEAFALAEETRAALMGEALEFRG